MNSPDHDLGDLERLLSADRQNPEIQRQLLMTIRRMDMDISQLGAETAETCLRILDPEFFMIPWTYRASQLIRIRAQEKNIPLSLYARQDAAYIFIPLEELDNEVADFGNTFGYLRIPFVATSPKPLEQPLSVEKLIFSVTFEQNNFNQGDPFTGFGMLEGLRTLELSAFTMSNSGTQRPGWIDDRIFHELCSAIVERNQDLHTLCLPNGLLMNNEVTSAWPLRFPKLRKILVNDISHTVVSEILLNTAVEEICIPLHKKDDNFHNLLPTLIIRKEQGDILIYSIDPAHKSIPKLNINRQAS